MTGDNLFFTLEILQMQDHLNVIKLEGLATSSM